MSLEEDVGRGRKKTFGSTSVTSTQDALQEDRRLTIRAPADRFDMGFGTVHRILTNELKILLILPT